MNRINRVSGTNQINSKLNRHKLDTYTQDMSTINMNPSQQLILIVDPYSTGCMVAQEISKRGYPLMA